MLGGGAGPTNQTTTSVHHHHTPNNQHEIPRSPIQTFEYQHIHATIKVEPVRDIAALTSADPPEPSSHRRMCQDRECENRQETRPPRLSTRRAAPIPCAITVLGDAPHQIQNLVKGRLRT